LRHLTPGRTYLFTVRARDNLGGNVSGSSNTLAVTMPASNDVTPPTAPTNLTATSLEDFCGSVLLNWTQSTDDTDIQSEIEYELYKDGVFFDLVTGTGSRFVYAGSQSTWYIVAVDRAGNSSARSNSVSVTTNADQNLC
jgi:hypothetical protein